MRETIGDTAGEHREDLSDFAASLRAVVQAGLEHGHEDVASVELPAETLERAGEIYRDQTAS